MSMPWTLASWRLASNALGARKGRTALMLGAVGLAASLIVAVSTVIGSVQGNLDASVRRILGFADARLMHEFSSPFDASALDLVRTWPEVEDATGRYVAMIVLRRAPGEENEKPTEVDGQAIGVDFDRELEFRDVAMGPGRYPSASDEILIDTVTAERLQAAVGDELIALGPEGQRRLRVAGVWDRFRFGFLERSLVRIDRGVSAELAGEAGRITSVQIKLKPGTDVEAFCAAHRGELPEELSLEPAEMARAGFDRRVEASRIGFVLSSILAFMSAAFIIVTALTTAVAERQREMALVRCVGGSRSQLFVAQLLLGGFVGGLGAIIGIPLGLGLAGILLWWFSDMLPIGMQMHSQGIVLAAIGSVVAGVVGAAYPAWLAAHVPPLEAMAARAKPTRGSSIVWCATVALACIFLQLVLFAPADGQMRFWGYMWAGFPLIYLGYFLLSIPVIWIAARWLGGPLARLLGLPGDMVRRTVLATPFRHGFTAGALMVGMSLLIASWAGADAVLGDFSGKVQFADAFAVRWSGLTSDEQRTIDDLPTVRRSTPISLFQAQIKDQHIFGLEEFTPRAIMCIGVDPNTFFEMNALEWTAGDPDAAIRKLRTGEGIVVSVRFLRTGAVDLGDTLTLGSGRVERTFEIVGAVNAYSIEIAAQTFGVRRRNMDFAVSSLFMSAGAMAEHFQFRVTPAMQLELAEGADEEALGDEIRALAPGAVLRSGRVLKTTLNSMAQSLLTIETVLAFAALLLACVGVGHVILANIHSRRFEFGVVRAVGGSRSALARLVFAEASLMALTAVIVGTMLGMHHAWIASILYRNLAGIMLNLVFPLGPGLIGAAVLLVVTLGAALPGVLSITRPRPGDLLALGRAG